MEIEKKPHSTSSLAQWLAWLEWLHPVEMELGLKRVSEVAARAGLLEKLPVVISVAGTNGKGSVVAMLSAMYHAAGYRVGSYTSPHIVQFNERICVNSVPAADASIVAALTAIEPHRGQQSLTYFEYTTLAAMRLFKDAEVDLAILEVGLGGRLDAVNIWDADCAVVSSIAVDHESWLGADRNVIALEKAGIARSGRPLVVGDADVPATLLEYAQSIAARTLVNGVDFHWREATERWQLSLPDRTLDLPRPSLAGAHQLANAAAAVTAVETLQARLPVQQDAMAEGLQLAHVVGRFERRVIEGVDIVIDVAHNPAAAAALAQTLGSEMPNKKAHAVFGIMADKDIDAVVAALSSVIASWHLAQLSVDRALPAIELAERLRRLQSCDNIQHYPSVVAAFNAALGSAQAAGVSDATTAISKVDQAETRQSDYVLVFGSFFTVAEMTDHS